MAEKGCRSLKVYEQYGYNDKGIPVIHLQGQWLKKMGFESGKFAITLDGDREQLIEAKKMFMEKELPH